MIEMRGWRNWTITYLLVLFVAVAAQLVFLFNFCWSLFRGAKAGPNPWDATTLEWTIPSPPPHDNFGGKEPVVNHGPYEFAVPGAEKDFVMQTDPPSAVPAGH